MLDYTDTPDTILFFQSMVHIACVVPHTLSCTIHKVKRMVFKKVYDHKSDLMVVLQEKQGHRCSDSSSVETMNSCTTFYGNSPNSSEDVLQGLPWSVWVWFSWSKSCGHIWTQLKLKMSQPFHLCSRQGSAQFSVFNHVNKLQENVSINIWENIKVTKYSSMILYYRIPINSGIHLLIHDDKLSRFWESKAAPNHGVPSCSMFCVSKTEMLTSSNESFKSLDITLGFYSIS